MDLSIASFLPPWKFKVSDERNTPHICMLHGPFRAIFTRRVGSPHRMHFPGMNPKSFSKCWKFCRPIFHKSNVSFKSWERERGRDAAYQDDLIQLDHLLLLLQGLFQFSYFVCAGFLMFRDQTLLFLPWNQLILTVVEARMCFTELGWRLSPVAYSVVHIV